MIPRVILREVPEVQVGQRDLRLPSESPVWQPKEPTVARDNRSAGEEIDVSVAAPSADRSTSETKFKTKRLDLSPTAERPVEAVAGLGRLPAAFGEGALLPSR